MQNPKISARCLLYKQCSIGSQTMPSTASTHISLLKKGTLSSVGFHEECRKGRYSLIFHAYLHIQIIY